MALPAACVTLGLPAATILAAGTGIGLLINRYVETRLEPQTLQWSMQKVTMLGVVFSAGAIFVTMEYFRNRNRNRRSTPRSSGVFGNQTAPIPGGGGVQHMAFPTERRPANSLTYTQSQSIPQYADEVPFDRSSIPPRSRDAAA